MSPVGSKFPKHTATSGQQHNLRRNNINTPSNQRTQNKTRRELITTLLEGRDTPGDLSLSSNLPSPLKKPTRVHTGDAVPLTFEEPEDRTGIATLRCRKKADASKKRGVKRKAS